MMPFKKINPTFIKSEHYATVMFQPISFGAEYAMFRFEEKNSETSKPMANGLDVLSNKIFTNSLL